MSPFGPLQTGPWSTGLHGLVCRLYPTSQCFLPSFESNGLSVQKKRKIDFQDGRHGSYLGFLISKILVFLIYKSPRCFLPSLKSISLSVQEKKRKIGFQDGCHGSHLGFPIGTILVIFDLQVTPMLPSKLGVNWPFSSVEEAKNRFSRWLSWRPSWISDWNDFIYF